MGLSVCPVAIVAASVEVVWANLTEWERYFDWSGVRVKRMEPEGPVAAGQTVEFTGMGVGFTFKVVAVDPAGHEIGGHAFFPLGLQEKSHIVCTPIDAARCSVQYH